MEKLVQRNKSYEGKEVSELLLLVLLCFLIIFSEIAAFLTVNKFKWILILNEVCKLQSDVSDVTLNSIY